MLSLHPSMRRYVRVAVCTSALFLANNGGHLHAQPAVKKVVSSSNTALQIALPQDALLDETKWQRLDDNASWRAVGDKKVAVRGAIATPLNVGALQRAEFQASLRFLVPENCDDWASVALALYGSDNSRQYAAVVFKRPGSTVGQGELLFEGKERIPFNLKPGQWHTLALQQSQKKMAVKVWTDGEAPPQKWQLQTDSANASINRVGVRTYAAEVEVSDLQLAGKSGELPPLNRAEFAQPVFDREPGYVELYWKVCEQASAHVLEQPGLPQPRYMDEALWDDTIWIWDTCFMALYCRYSPRALPGLESLQNFYEPMHDGVKLNLADSPTSIIVQHPDNPPLFAWVEWQSYQMTGDKARLKWLLQEKQYLQKNYDWFNNVRRGQTFPWARAGVALSPQPLGFQWNGVASGMDNSPRFAGKDVLAIDALAQQGLNAKCIERMAEIIGDKKTAAKFKAEYKRVSDLVNTHYWDEVDGFYYDLMPDGKTFSKVRTPASFWPVLAGMASPEKVRRMAQRVGDAKDLGGIVPWVTVSRSDPAFNAKDGNYWNGAMWLPTAYMGIKALEQNGQIEVADQSAEAVLQHMYLTYRDYAPHTIWECYNPSKPEPAYHGGNRVTPNFCGWSALGPISLFIENVMGFHRIDGEKRVVEWRLHQAGRHGIKNLRFGNITSDILTDGRKHLEVNSDGAFTLVVNGKTFKVKKGQSRFSLS
ncbi:hypothetical protein EON80_00285 [bacterium]|nr:MAG: hypothetical protein EON80_00285 [bacterium]